MTPRLEYPTQQLLHQTPVKNPKFSPRQLHIHRYMTRSESFHYLLSETASTVWRVENLIVKDREVQGQTKTDRVGWSQFGVSNVLQIQKGEQVKMWISILR